MPTPRPNIRCRYRCGERGCRRWRKFPLQNHKDVGAILCFGCRCWSIRPYHRIDWYVYSSITNRKFLWTNKRHHTPAILNPSPTAKAKPISPKWQRAVNQASTITRAHTRTHPTTHHPPPCLILTSFHHRPSRDPIFRLWLVSERDLCVSRD